MEYIDHDVTMLFEKFFAGLQESYEELQALLLTRSVQEGRSLLTGSNNLAAELEEMTQDDVSVFIKVWLLC